MWSGSGKGLDPEELAHLRSRLELRGRVYRVIREFFHERGYLEIEAPVRIRTPALEEHIDAVSADDAWLRTSPELHLKRLLCAGYERVYHLGPCFRKNEHGRLHNPEYTMLEWYRADADYVDVLADTKALITRLAEEVCGSTDIHYAGRPLALLPIWEMMSVEEAFGELAGWNPVENWDEDRFDMDLVRKIESGLPRDRPVILKDYPLEAGALARRKPSDPRVCERWELYIAGIEMANAYSELTDPEEQRARFTACAEKRAEAGKVVYEMDELFLEAMEKGMPPCAGVALGVDRLLMLLGDSPDIGDFLPFREVSR